jgi:hypothetical protein
MIISWDGKLQKIRATAYAGFEKCLREDPVIQAAMAQKRRPPFETAGATEVSSQPGFRAVPILKAIGSINPSAV